MEQHILSSIWTLKFCTASYSCQRIESSEGDQWWKQLRDPLPFTTATSPPFAARQRSSGGLGSGLQCLVWSWVLPSILLSWWRVGRHDICGFDAGSVFFWVPRSNGSIFDMFWEKVEFDELITLWLLKVSNLPSRELTYPPENGHFEDDFPFPKINPLEGMPFISLWIYTSLGTEQTEIGLAPGRRRLKLVQMLFKQRPKAHWNTTRKSTLLHAFTNTMYTYIVYICAYHISQVWACKGCVTSGDNIRKCAA